MVKYRLLAFLVLFGLPAFSLASLNDGEFLQKQQQLYRGGDWGRFFGRAIYFRWKLERGAKLSDEASRVIALEALGLGHKCRWEEAIGLLRGLPDSPVLFRTHQSLLLDGQFFSKLETKASALNESKIFNPTLLWRINEKQMRAVKNPDQLRVEVANQCASRIPASSIRDATIQGNELGGQLLEGLAHYAAGDLDHAATLLEEVLRGGKVTESVQARASFILAFASNLVLFEKKRHDYAEWAYRLRLNLGLHRDSVAALLRISGDGRFDEGQWAASRAQYEALKAQADDSSLKNYAEYRLGWVDLNEGKVAPALSRWLDLLDAKRSELEDSNQALLGAIQRDLGKQWVELAEVSPSETEKLNQLLTRLPAQSAEAKQGFFSRMDRVTATVTLKTIQNVMAASQVSRPWIESLIEKGYFSKRGACSVLPFLGSSGYAGVSETLLGQTLACARSVADRGACETKEGKEVSALLSRLELTGDSRLASAAHSVDCRDWVPACVQLGNEILLNFSNHKSRYTREVEDTFVRACLEGHQVDHPSRVLEAYWQENLFLPAGTDSLEYVAAGIFSDQTRREVWKNRIWAEPARFKLTRFPQLLFDSYPDAERTVALKQGFLTRYSRQNQSQWSGVQLSLIHDLISQGKVNEAREQLEKAYGIEPWNNHWLSSEVWAAWGVYFLSAPVDLEGSRVERWLQVTADKIQLSPELYFSVAMRFGEFDDLWKNYSHFRTVFTQNPEWLVAFYEESFENLDSIEETSLAGVAAGRGLLALEHLIDRREAYRFSPERYFGKTRFGVLGMIDTLKRIEQLGGKVRKGRLSIAPSLPKMLARKMMNFEKLRQTTILALVDQNPTFDGIYTEMAWHFDQSRNVLIAELARLKNSALIHSNLTDLAVQIDGLMRQLASLALQPSDTSRTPSSSKVIDLGDVELSTDVRRPSLTWLDSQKTVRSQLAQLVRRELEEFEESLLRH